MKDRYLWWCRKDVELERRHAVEEGRDLGPLEAEFAALKNNQEDQQFQKRFNDLMDRVAQQPIRPDFPYREPSDLEGICSERPVHQAHGPSAQSAPRANLPDDQLRDRLHGAWLGRCAGCLLGKPLEGVRTPALWGLLADAGHDRLSDYLWRMGIPEELFVKHELDKRILPYRSTAAMPEDDDTNYTVMGLAIVAKHGLDFTPAQVADFWLNNVPIMRTCTAERIAYRNFVAGLEPPASASFRNCCREWIGARIRADFYGYVLPGQGERAAELAWRDARISHTRNGIYGAMWVAAMLAAAPVESDPRRLIEAGLSQAPDRSRLAEGLRDVLGWHAQGHSYRQAIQQIHQRWDEHNWHDWHHTVANAQVVAVALLWGGGDFGQAITRAVYPGFDTDCNGATTGSVMGMVLGAKGIDNRWTDLMNDTLLTGVSGYHNVRISEMAQRTLDLHRDLARSQP
jgi:ADP-ribosylglycohydrolase